MAYSTYAYDKNQAEAPRDHKDFESKFEARIEDSREYKQYSRRMPYYMWDGKQPLNTEVEVVPMKAIHLTIDNLERLMKEQEHLKLQSLQAEYDKQLIYQLRADERVRMANPSVAKAYKNYQMLLELARK
jgi:hypothetical protein